MPYDLSNAAAYARSRRKRAKQALSGGQLIQPVGRRGVQDIVEVNSSNAPRYTPPTARDRDMARRIKIIKHNFPILKDNPQALLNAAELPYDTPELADRFAKADAWQQMRRVAASMSKQPADQQRKLWDAYTRPYRRTLRSLGYAPPEEPNDDGGIFGGWSPMDLIESVPIAGAAAHLAQGDVKSALFNVATLGASDMGAKAASIVADTADAAQQGLAALSETPVAPVSDFALNTTQLGTTGLGHVSDFFTERVAQPVLSGLDTLADVPLHVYRAEQYMSDRIAQEGRYGNEVGDFIEAWQKTEDPDGSFQPQARRRVRNMFEDDEGDVVAAVEDFAAGRSLEDIVGERHTPGTMKYQNMYLKLYGLQGQPKVQKAVEILQGSRVGFGADLTRAVGLDTTSQLGQLVSTAADFTVMWMLDPVMIGGRALHTGRMARSIPLDNWNQVETVFYDETSRAIDQLGDDVFERAARPAAEGGLTSADFVGIKGASGHLAWSQRVAEFAREGKWQELINADGKIAPLVEDLKNRHRDLQRLNAEKQVVGEIAAGQRAAGPINLADLPDDIVDAQKGIESFADVADYIIEEGAKTIASAGRYNKPTSNGLHLPSLTRAGLTRARARETWTQTISDWATYGSKLARDADRGKAELWLPGGIVGGERVEGTLVGVAAPAEGYTRLYRVQVGTGEAARHGVPGYVKSNIQELSDAQAAGHWWTSELELAQYAAENMMPAGRLHILDVPNAVADANRIENYSPVVARMAHRPNAEYLITGDDVLSNAREIGTMSMWMKAADGSMEIASGSRVLASFGRIMQYATKQLPKSSVLKTTGPDAPVEFGRFLDIGYDGQAKAQLFNMFVNADSPVYRRQLIKAVADSMMYHAGMYQSEKGKAFAERVLSGFETKIYGVNGTDVMTNAAGTYSHQPFLAVGDWADGLKMPTMREMKKYAERTNMLDHLMGGLNSEVVDGFMGYYWKPAVLLRLGFIPRAAGEELLSSLLRYPDMLGNRFKAGLDKMLQGAHPEEPVWMVKPLASAARHMQARLPLEVIEAGEMPFAIKMMNWMESHITGYVRGMARRHMSPESLDYAYAVANEPAVQTAIGQHLYGAVGGQHGVAGTELTQKMIDRKYPESQGLKPTSFENQYIGADETGLPQQIFAFELDDEGRIVALETVGSEFQLYDATSMFYGGMYRHNVDHFVRDDPIGRQVMAALNSHVGTNQADFVSSVIDGVRRTQENRRTSRLFDRFDAEVGLDAHGRVRAMRHKIHDDPAVQREVINYLDNRDLEGIAYTDKRTGEQVTHKAVAEKSLNNLKGIARGSNDPVTHVLAETIAELPEGVARMLTIDRREVLGPVTAADRYTSRWAGDQEVSVGGTPVEDMTREEFMREYERLERRVHQAEKTTPLPEDLESHIEDGKLDINSIAFSKRRGYSDKEIADFQRYLYLSGEGRGFPFDDLVRVTEDGYQGGDPEAIFDAWQGSVTGSVRERRMAWLWSQAEAGDINAARQLANEVAQRELQNPEYAMFVRDNVRSKEARGDRFVAIPVRDGEQRVYFPVVAPDSVAAVNRAAANGSPEAQKFANSRIQGSANIPPAQSAAAPQVPLGVTPRELAQQRSRGRRMIQDYVDPDVQARVSRAMESAGYGPQVAASTHATADYDEAVAVLDELKRAVPESQVSLRFVDVRDEDFAEFRQLAQESGVGYGTHDYQLTEAQMYRGHPFDLTGPVQRDGVTALPGITMEEALQDWADVYVKGALDLVASKRDGRVLHEVAARAAKTGRYEPEWYHFKGPNHEDMPVEVFGPKVRPQKIDLREKIIQFGFGKIISPAVSRIAREPLFHYLAEKRWTAAKNNVLPGLIDEELVRRAEALLPKLPTDDVNEVRRIWRAMPEKLRTSTTFGSAEDIGQLAATLGNAGIENAAAWADALHNLKQQELGSLRFFAANQEYANTQAAQLAMEGAARDMLPFIDDHTIRSQFADMIRNVIPFFFAEEQFIKRWARTLVHSPEAIARAQLVYMGFKHVGFIHEDDHGNDVFVYPGTGLLQDLIARVGQPLFGDMSLPIAASLVGSVQSSAPGFDRFGVPGFSPVVTIPMTLIARRFPELAEWSDETLGQTAGRSIAEQLIPASVMRVWSAIQNDPERDPQFASAMIQAMQYLEAAGAAPTEEAQAADPTLTEEYHDRVVNWTRTLLLSRAIYGFMGPAAPTGEFPMSDLGVEYAKLIKAVGIEEAPLAFMERHGKDALDATPWTVFRTENVSGAPIAPTEEAGRFIRNNGDFITKYKLGSAWLLPQSGFDDPIDDAAYNQQLQAGLRERRLPSEWQEEFYYKRASGPYFESKDRYEIARASTPDAEGRKALDEGWKQWSQQWKDMHPVFARLVESGDAQRRRMQTVQELTLALNDPDLPNVAHVKQLRDMMGSWLRYDSAMKNMTGDQSNAAIEARDRLRRGFYTWAEQYTHKHPKMRPFWRNVLEPEVGLDAGDLTDMGVY